MPTLADVRSPSAKHCADFELLIEAKTQQPHGEFLAWFDRQHFKFQLRQAQVYMNAVRATFTTEKPRVRVLPQTLSEAVGDTCENRGERPVDAVRTKLQAFNWARFNQEQAEAAKERELVRACCMADGRHRPLRLS
jgi:hypothetical protein